MTKLFKKKDESERRSARYQINLNEAEVTEIRHLAKIRQMGVAEFMRRAALGRKADVDYETEIVLALIGITKAIRGLHKGMVEQGFPPPEELLLPVILDARAAMLRISK